MKNTTESTNGQIIGGDHFQATLIQPSGKEYGNPKCFIVVAEAMEWARKCRVESLEQMGIEPAIAPPWTLRITGCPDLDVDESRSNPQWPVGIPYKKEER